VSTLVVYLGYLIVVLALYLRPARRAVPPTPRPAPEAEKTATSEPART
jgi:hypothetical protein